MVYLWKSWKTTFENLCDLSPGDNFLSCPRDSMFHYFEGLPGNYHIESTKSFVKCTKHFQRKHWKIKFFFSLVPRIAQHLTFFLPSFHNPFPTQTTPQKRHLQVIKSCCRSSLVAQWVKHQAMSLLWLWLLLWQGVYPWPGNFHRLREQPKRKKWICNCQSNASPDFFFTATCLFETLSSNVGHDGLLERDLLRKLTLSVQGLLCHWQAVTYPLSLSFLNPMNFITFIVVQRSSQWRTLPDIPFLYP